MDNAYHFPCFFKEETKEEIVVVDPLTHEEVRFPLDTVREIVKHPNGSGHLIVDAWIARQKQLI